MPQKRDINSCNFSWRVYYWVNNNVTRMCTRFTVLHRVTPLYIYIYTHARAHFSFQFRGGGSELRGGGGGGRNAKFGTGEKPRSDTFHYLMRGTWLGARQLSRSCVFHLDNYLGPSRVSHVDYVVQKNARGNVNGIQHGAAKTQRDYGFRYIYT